VSSSSSSSSVLLPSELTAEEQDMVPRADEDASDDSDTFSQTVSKVELRFLLLLLTTEGEVPEPRDRLLVTGGRFDEPSAELEQQ
jgi:hypothetical protein